MKDKKYFSLFCLLLLIIIFKQPGHSSGLTQFFQLNVDNASQAKNIKVNPAREFFFLPEINNKSIFESIDDLSICRYRLVREYIYQYLSDARTFLVNGITRSKRYIPIVEKIFNEHDDIPDNLALLPMLESGFNPYATSRSRAVGLWQLMKRTSGDLGLKINRWVDERRDIEKSTKAAIRHLQNLYKIFESWELALAAYNGGARTVKSAMNKTGSKTFAELVESGALKKETSEFVHRFAALAVIYKHQDLFNIKTEVTDPEITETDNILLKYPVKINDLSKIAGVPLTTIKMFNPELKRNITPPYEKEYSVRIPKDSIDKYEKNKSKLYAVKFKRLRKHIVKEGESLTKIAEVYKTKMNKIIQINNLKNPDLIKPGQEIYIPL